jgi:hypothetical protein
MFDSKSLAKDTRGPTTGPSAHDANALAPGKQSLVQTDGLAEASAASAHGWKPPSVGEVGDWLLQWTLTWADQAGQAFTAFSTAVRADSNKSSNVGALISMAGNAVWVLGGLVANPPAEILGAGLSAIGAFVHGGAGKNDDQLLLALQQGLDRFTDQLNRGVSNRDHWAFVVKDSGVRHAGSDAKAQAVVRGKLHIPDTSNVGALRRGIETKLIGQYLNAKHAYIEHETAETLGGPITEDHLKGISGNVAGAFTSEMGINPMPTKDRNRTANPFHLPVKDKFTIIT